MVTKFWLAEAAPVIDSREHDRELNVTNRPIVVVLRIRYEINKTPQY